MNYNVQYKKKSPGYIFAGGRLGYTSFEYDVDGPPMTDPVWGSEVPFRFSGIKGCKEAKDRRESTGDTGCFFGAPEGSVPIFKRINEIAEKGLC